MKLYCRSREGAWIEMSVVIPFGIVYTVAPVRERGLKWLQDCYAAVFRCRSREGAWIEITYKEPLDIWHLCRSREGAWIEISCWLFSLRLISVAPVRERGLKLCRLFLMLLEILSLP